MSQHRKRKRARRKRIDVDIRAGLIRPVFLFENDEIVEGDVLGRPQLMPACNVRPRASSLPKVVKSMADKPLRRSPTMRWRSQQLGAMPKTARSASISARAKYLMLLTILKKAATGSENSQIEPDEAAGIRQFVL